jgi:hypothetical protein
MPQTWTDLLVHHRQWEMDMRFGIWNVISIYRPGSLRIVDRELRYRLNLVGVQDVRWEKTGTIRVQDYTFVCGKRHENQLGTGFFVHQKIVPAVRRVEFVSGGMCFIALRGR